MGKVSFALGLGAGYVLGTRAGRARYEQIQHAAVSLTEKPQVQEAVGKVRDSLPAPLQNAVDGLVPKSSSGGSASSSSRSSSSAPSSTAAATAAAGGSFPLEEDDEVVAQTYSALRERTAEAPSTEDPGTTGGPVVVNSAAEDEDPVAQTFSAFTERSADDPATEHTR
jgi:hypothetical protein